MKKFYNLGVRISKLLRLLNVFLKANSEHPIEMSYLR